MSMEASCGMLSSSGGSSSPASCTSHTGAVGGLYFGQRHPDHLAFPVDAVTGNKKHNKKLVTNIS